MDGLLDAPAFVIVAFTLGSALLLIEVALPTLGVAGITGTALAVTGLLAVDRQREPWWPLVLVALAVCVWAVMLVRRSAPVTAQATAAGLYAAGGIGYGIVAGDVPAAVVATVCAVAVAAAYPRLCAATARLLNQPPQVGMEALVGHRAVVVERVDEHHGRVRIEGALWSATASRGWLPEPGETVQVAGYDGMMLLVTPVTVSS